MNFNLLVKSIQQIHSFLQQSAVMAINRHITIRNWLIGFLNQSSLILQSPIAELQNTENEASIILQSLITKSPDQLQIPSDKLISKLSFTHLIQLLSIADHLKRTFYELECIKGNWSVRELRRQINSLYFERCGLSKNPAKLSAMIVEKAEPMQAVDVIKSVYAFEFLG